MTVTLKSRIPEIVTEIPLKVGVAIRAGTEEIAADAQRRADELYQDPDDKPFNIKAGSVGSKYGITAEWFWFFGEFGTTHQTAKPYMIPAAEAGKDNLAEAVRTALEGL